MSRRPCEQLEALFLALNRVSEVLMLQSMIRKSVQRFSGEIMLKTTN